MSGRHGKLSGAPFHVINSRGLASERYGDDFCRNDPWCKYKVNNVICGLPQNKTRYKKLCVSGGCQYLFGNNDKKRENCSFLINDKCMYKKLSNCTSSEDLAYCCDYYISYEANKELNRNLRENVQYKKLYTDVVDKIETLVKKQKFFMSNVNDSQKIVKNDDFNAFIKDVKSINMSSINRLKPKNLVCLKDASTMVLEIDKSKENLLKIKKMYSSFLAIVKENNSLIKVDENIDAKRVKVAFDTYCISARNYMKFINEMQIFY